MVVLARLKAKPLVAGQILCGLIAVGLMLRQVARAWGDGAVEIIRVLLLGNLLVTAAIVAALVGLAIFRRAWRRRAAYIWHDGSRLHRGDGESWPLPLIRDVVIVRSEIGIASLRLVVDDVSEVTRELVKLYLLEDRAEVVRQAVLFAAAGVRGFPGGSVMN